MKIAVGFLDKKTPQHHCFYWKVKKLTRLAETRGVKTSSSSNVNGCRRQKTEDLLLLKMPYLFRLPDEMLNDGVDEIQPKLLYKFGSMDTWDTVQFFEYANILRPYRKINRRLMTATNEDKLILDAMTDGAFSCRTLAGILINSFMVDTLNFRSEYKNLMGRIRNWAEQLVKAKLLFKGIIRSGENGVPVNRRLWPTYYYYSKRDTQEDIDREVLNYYRSLGFMLGRIGDKSKTVQKKYSELEELSFDTSPEGERLNELIMENELLKKTQRKGMKVRIVRDSAAIKKKTGKEGLERDREQRKKLRKKVKYSQQELKHFLVQKANNKKALPPP